MKNHPPRTIEAAPGVLVLVRGWLHGNSVLLTGGNPAVFDTGYHLGSDTLCTWVSENLQGRALHDVLLTHVHSDHAGGVAALRASSQARVHCSNLAHTLIERWDEEGLWLGISGQELPTFHADVVFNPGDTVRAGDTDWKVIATPGHMRCAVAFFAESNGVLITGDALWEHGFGLLDPWIEGLDCFDRTAETLATLRALQGVSIVIPGHGTPFTDMEAALGRAERRLESLRKDPDVIRRAIAQNGIGFLAMARPELGMEKLGEMVQSMLEEHPPFRPQPETPSAQVLVEQAFQALFARVSGAVDG